MSLLRSLGILTVLMFVWGLSIPATKIALADFPPFSLTAARYLVAAPCFAMLMRLRPLPPAGDLWAMLGLGLLGIVAGQILQAVGVVRTSASVATMLSATSPMFIAGFAALFLRQPVRSRHFTGMAIALAGVGIVAWDNDPTSGASLFGNLLCLTSTAAIAAYYVLASRLIARHGVLTVAGWSCLSGTIFLLPPAAWELASHRITPSIPSILIILYLGALVTVAGLYVWLTMLKTVPARIAASTQSLQPIFGIGGAMLLLGEPLTLRFAAGAVLVLSGIALAVVPGRQT